ncbi:MAG: BON domain-containing protein [Pyrinomonadaceae bacterium]
MSKRDRNRKYGHNEGREDWGYRRGEDEDRERSLFGYGKREGRYVGSSRGFEDEYSSSGRSDRQALTPSDRSDFQRGRFPDRANAGNAGSYLQPSPYDDNLAGDRVHYRNEDRYQVGERSWIDKAGDEVSSWFGDEEAARRREYDERRAQSQHGKGPRNYTRSDDRIREDVNDELADSWTLDATNIEVMVNDGEVVLTGTVENRSDKRTAEDTAEDVRGVKHVENRLRIVRGDYNAENDAWTSGPEKGAAKSA